MSAINKINVGGVDFDIEGKGGGIAYATSSTGASTTAKTASTADGGFELETGASVKVLFSNTNTASAPTLSIDGSTAKSIKGYGTTNPSSWWKAGDVVEFLYNGTSWIMQPTQGQLTDVKSDLVDVDGYNNLLSSSYDSSKHKTYAESYGGINSTGRNITKTITLDNGNVKAVYIKTYLSNNINICHVWHENTSATLSGTTLTINTTLKTDVSTNSNVWLDIEVIYA